MTPDPTVLRPVQEHDFEQIAALLNPYIEHTAIHFGTEPVRGAQLREEWLQGRYRYAYFVAETSGELVGIAKASPFRARPAYQWTAELGVYVHEQHHRRGIARGLYTTLIAECRAQGFHTLVAGIVLPNEPSVKLHESLGFHHVGTFPEVGFKLGSYHSVGFWNMLLSPSTLPPAPLRAPHSTG